MRHLRGRSESARPAAAKISARAMAISIIFVAAFNVLPHHLIIVLSILRRRYKLICAPIVAPCPCERGPLKPAALSFSAVVMYAAAAAGSRPSAVLPRPGALRSLPRPKQKARAFLRWRALRDSE